MSLKDKSCFTENVSGIAIERSFEVITLDDYREAVNGYLDAVSHPEKYPELYGEFQIKDKTKYYDCSECYGATYHSDLKWRDFLFLHFFGGRE